MSLSWLAAVAAAAPGAAFFALRRIRRNQAVVDMTKKVARRRAEREEHVEWARKAARGCTEQKREEIARLNFEQLQAALFHGKFACSEVVAAFLGRSVAAHEKTNCVTLYVKECMDWAHEWDEKAKAPGFVKPALFGIPISVKECLPVQGYDCTFGYASEAFKPVKHNTLMLRRLKELGAIPFVLTNVPFSGLAYTTGNEIYGWTRHPLNASRTPGGSTGGESALIAADGSVLGLGADIGGSIRTPCHFTGLAGIKPSTLRLSLRGTVPLVPGRPLINASLGPMAPTISTCVAMMRAVLADDWLSRHDRAMPPVLWNERAFAAGNKYTIGYYEDDGYFTATPGCTRAVREAKALLEKKGHKLVPFSPPSVSDAVRMFFACSYMDGGAFLIRRMSQDLPPAEFAPPLRLRRLLLRLQRLLGSAARLFSEERFADFCHFFPRTPSEVAQNYAAVGKYRENFAIKLSTAQIDALLCPPQVMPAPPHATPLRLQSAMSYTALFNLLDFAAGVVRVTEWNEEDERRLAEEYPETDSWYKEVKSVVKGSVGLPLGAQIAAPPFKEELVLRLLWDLEDAKNGK